MFGIFKRKEKPINVNDLANRHMVAALNAFHQSERDVESGTVASRHMPYIKMKHLAISNFLDRMLEANEKAKK